MSVVEHSGLLHLAVKTYAEFNLQMQQNSD